ncbi:MAG: hypothetical protein WAU88_12285 [Candidatus Zixiibacteriota bacterium]
MEKEITFGTDWGGRSWFDYVHHDRLTPLGTLNLSEDPTVILSVVEG